MLRDTHHPFVIVPGLRGHVEDHWQTRLAAKLPDASTGMSEGGEGQSLSLAVLTRAPGTIPAHVNPPRGSVSAPDEPLAASMAAQAPAPATRVASAAPPR